MALTILTPPTEIIHLTRISWQTCERLLDELRDRRLRLTYNRRNLEIMAPSPEHERYKKLAGRFVETLAEELDIRIEPQGSTPFKHPELIGAKPDECFYIFNIDAVLGKKHLSPLSDPPPDLVVDIDVTNTSRGRLKTYADLGVPEVWVYDGMTLTIQRLHEQDYGMAVASQFFPSCP